MNALLKFLERTSLLGGTILIALAGFAWFGGIANSRAAVADFEQIRDMAIPAGHRDGFFRGLKNISVGAEIELATLHGQQKFRVSEILIVDPLDVSVLSPADETMTTTGDR